MIRLQHALTTINKKGRKGAVTVKLEAVNQRKLWLIPVIKLTKFNMFIYSSHLQLLCEIDVVVRNPAALIREL